MIAVCDEILALLAREYEAEKGPGKTGIALAIDVVIRFRRNLELVCKNTGRMDL